MNKKFSKYAVLGDDVVIADDRVAGNYREMMAALDVEIAEAKSISSSSLFEFAKRLHINGVDHSGFPVAAIVEDSKVATKLAVTLSIESTSRGYYNRDG